ncbi:MerR family transcriptional regulator [Winogradskya humida]|uniref:HTH merR-type domain-containing protein n=1 Tax=Winogradskya humida TaxID=113566 RepID=A0ABQ3ZZN1_9ACTN|nr:MerR family transcriptional regulator [Actinoplanes humidus]GIE24034.1 hypothetical protein Ahu01nite_071360 [Actinoplanes humidus]
MVGMWTMDELVDRVRQALAAEYAGAPNGRVRDVPDRRAIRWYTTTGLVDRPSGMRGRSALYGPRHLAQIVAVKRRQAQGHSLAAIQAELTGASEAELAAVAQLPVVAPLSGESSPAPARFWAAAPSLPAAPSPGPRRPAASTEVSGITLGGGAVLVLPVRLSAGDLDAVTAAAAPLLALLHDRGLLITTEDGSPS